MREKVASRFDARSLAQAASVADPALAHEHALRIGFPGVGAEMLLGRHSKGSGVLDMWPGCFETTCGDGRCDAEKVLRRSWEDVEEVLRGCFADSRETAPRRACRICASLPGSQQTLHESQRHAKQVVVPQRERSSSSRMRATSSAAAQRSSSNRDHSIFPCTPGWPRFRALILLTDQNAKTAASGGMRLSRPAA